MGRRIKLNLLPFNANVLTVKSLFYHFKPKYADKKGVLSSKNKNF